MNTLLMLDTAIIVVAFCGIVAYLVYRITLLLEKIGGNGNSYLAKLRLGLRAIEIETGHLPTEVTKLNEGLTMVAGGLQMVDDRLMNTIDAVVKQKGG
jgi:hypothetical protein